MDDPAIRTQGLTKRFGSVTALDGLDLVVNPGEAFGFLGPNGAGKSTTIRLLLHLLRPTAGRARITGVPVDDVERAHQHVSYVPGDVSLWPQMTGAEILTHLGHLSGRTGTAFREELVERLRPDPSQRARSYSRGNRQKIALVAAFMTRPDVLLLDEPTVGLDPLMEAEFQALVREAAAQGQTVFLSSHLLDEVEDVCHRVAILREGRLVEVAALEDLRRFGTTVFEAVIDGPVPQDLESVLGVTAVQRIDGGVRVTVTRSPAAVLQRLAAAGLVRLRSHEPTLEQVFLPFLRTAAVPTELHGHADAAVRACPRLALRLVMPPSGGPGHSRQSTRQAPKEPRTR